MCGAEERGGSFGTDGCNVNAFRQHTDWTVLDIVCGKLWWMSAVDSERRVYCSAQMKA